MKIRLEFTLEPRKLFNVWMIFYVLVLVPYAYYFIRYSLGKKELLQPGLAFLAILAVVTAALVLYFYFTRLFIGHLRIGERKLEFHSDMQEYLGRALAGFLLSIVTMTLYLAWFMRDLVRFFINGSYLDGEPFSFRGRADRLFVLLLLTFYLPMIVVSLISVRIPVSVMDKAWYMFVNQAVMSVLMIPYMYHIYAWMVDVRYKDYYIYWDTSFGEAFPVMLREVLLGILTLGIYMPMAWLRLYHFFAERTIVAREGKAYRLEYDLNAAEDFAFFWGQILLLIGSLGLYGPWALCKLGRRIITKTCLVPLEYDG